MDLSHLSNWVCRNTRAPKNDSRNFSFRGHEFQAEIINDSAAELDVRKCSQVGVSELFARLTLAFLAVRQNHTAIYTLPTGKFAANFAKSRIDPIITASPLLKSMVPSTSDSASLKQIGRSFLHIAGTFTQGSAISVPADMLINDELDFSDQVVTTTYESRLGHAENGGLKRRFSTPTVTAFGISAGYDDSSRARYAVRCDSCSSWVMPEFFEDIVLPGFTDHLLKFEKADIQECQLDLNKAMLLCPSCRRELTIANLADPAKRQWVHAHPDHHRHGYQVLPYDAPLISSVADTLRQIKKYRRKADWVNFKVGLPFEDSESSIMDEALTRAMVLPPVIPRPHAATGCVIGMDLGKVCHIVIGRRVSPARMEVIHLETVRQRTNSEGENSAVARAVQLIEWFGVEKAVIDAAPDFSAAMAIIDACYFGVAFGNYYTRRAPSTMTNHTFDPGEQVVKSYRTGTLDHTVKEVNSGRVFICVNDQEPVVRAQLRAIKRLSQVSEDGVETATWVHSGPDHYAHALNYMMIADELNSMQLAGTGIGVLPMASSVRLKETSVTRDGYDAR